MPFMTFSQARTLLIGWTQSSKQKAPHGTSKKPYGFDQYRLRPVSVIHARVLA